MFSSVIGVLASINTGGAPVYFTTVLYPVVFDEALGITALGVSHGTLWENPADDANIGQIGIVVGSLTETITYQSYANGAIEPLGIGAIGIVVGSLTETITYQSYATSIEPITIGIISISSGTLT